MHELFSQVLKERDLSRAGDLFSLDDKTIVEDLSQVLAKIQEIASASDFIHNDNDQSVVEISITRVTSAIRDTGTIEKHGPALVSLLESCLNHDLRPSPKDEDPPHAKITSDLVSCIFLNHNRKSVMKLALPISVKFLHRGNKELSRNLSSYLSLAAINNAELLAPHIQPIIDSIIGGNYSLARVLPQIYAVNKHPIHDHVMALVSLLPQCEEPEKLSLLNLFGLIAKQKPSLLESNLPQLSECLTIANTASSSLQIFLDMAAARPQLFTEHMQKIKGAAELQPNTIPLVARIMGIVGKLSIERARESLDFLIGQISKVEHSALHGVLREIRTITETFPSVLPEVFPKISAQLESLASSTARMHLQRLRAELNANKVSLQMVNNSKGGVTIVKVGGSKNDISTSSNSPMTLSNTSQVTGSTHSPISSITSLSGSHTHSIKNSRANFNHSRSHLINHHDSRSLGSLHAVNRSMGRLPLTGPHPTTSHQNISRLSGSPGITASMTRLHHHSGSSSVMNRSMTAIGNSRQNILLLNHNQTVPTSMSSHFNSSQAPGSKICSGGVTVVTTSTSHKSIVGSLLALQEVSPSVVMVSINGSSATGDSSSSPPFLHHHHHHHHHHHPVNGMVTSSPTVVGGAVSGSMQTSSSPSHSSQPLSSTSMQEVSTAESQRDSPSFCGGMTPASLSSPSTTPPRLRIHNNKGNNATRITMNSDGINNTNTQRISVFEPYPMRDAIQHFCEKHLDKIKAYMLNVFAKIPLPVKCTIEERKSKKHAKLHFVCQGKGEHCLYNKTLFTMKTRNPRVWIHLMFLALQARATSALSTRESSVSSLKNCWDTLKADVRSFLTLVTSAFPSAKDQDNLIAELRNSRFFDVFEYNAPAAIWGCFLCNHPDRAQGFLQANAPVIEGQLKEKKGKWKLFKRWRTRYFTLSGAHLSYRGSKDEKDTQPIEVSQIRSVRAISSRGRNIPKAFEIFTHDKTFVLKAKDSKNTEQWVQCLSIAMAHSHAKEVIITH